MHQCHLLGQSFPGCFIIILAKVPLPPPANLLATLFPLLLDVQFPLLLLKFEVVADFLELPGAQTSGCDTEVMMAFTSWAVGGLVRVTKYIEHVTVPGSPASHM